MGLDVWHRLSPRPEEAGRVWAALRLSQGLFPAACFCDQTVRREAAGERVSVVCCLVPFAAMGGKTYCGMDGQEEAEGGGKRRSICGRKLNRPSWHGCIYFLRPYSKWPGLFLYGS